MPYRIPQLRYVEIRSLDLDRDLDHYVNVLGLHLSGREGRTAYLSGRRIRSVRRVSTTHRNWTSHSSVFTR